MNATYPDPTDALPEEHLYKDYRLRNLHGRNEPATAQAIVRFWLEHGVLPAAEAHRRVTEVVYAAFDRHGALAGVNTVYTGMRPDDGQTYYFYRTFIRPADRGVFGLPRTMLRLTLEHLGSRTAPTGPVGLMIVTENPKLMRKSSIAIATRMGLHRLGKDSRGYDVWGLRFDGGIPLPLPTGPG
ncbi:MAG: hypothetical protein IPG66_03565 [Hydrogenophilales bacterium]|nr:hypothetical protein [Hydrogenophilales bacterium]